MYKHFEKIHGFCETYSKTFEDFLSALDAVSNDKLTYKIIDPVTLERYDLQKTSPNYQLVF